MTDNLSPEDRIKTMRAVKSQNTGPERRLRAMLIGMGLKGWRLNYKVVSGKPDIAFPEIKLAIFIDGCFWHGCPECNRPLPQKNREYWEQKIGRTIERDKRCQMELTAEGWTVLRIWGHELSKKSDLTPVAEKIRESIDHSRRKTLSGEE